MEIAKYIFSIFLSVLGKLFPIDERTFVFNSFPDMSDNAYAMFLELCKRNNLLLVWIVEKRNDYEDRQFPTDSRVVVVNKKSLRALYFFLRARLVVVTHSIYCNYRNYNKHKIILNTGHGMPLKRIGKMDGHSWVPNLDYTISSSPLFQEIMAKCYGVPLEKVLITGSPKCDMLFMKTDFYAIHNLKKESYKRVGLWMPTFRATNKIFTRTDGEFNEHKISFMPIERLFDFNKFLEDNGVLLFIKLHPMDLLQNVEFPKYSNLQIFKQSDMKEQLYPFLGSVDFLLTDYSSVWVDFDMLGKPIGFVVDDFEKYSKDRGFTTDIENVFPNDIIQNEAELRAYILRPTRIKKDIYNSFKDRNSSARVLEALNI